MNKLNWNIDCNSHIFIQENAFENVICEILTILFWLQCVKEAQPEWCHNSDKSTMASQITGNWTVCSTACSGNNMQGLHYWSFVRETYTPVHPPTNDKKCWKDWYHNVMICLKIWNHISHCVGIILCVSTVCHVGVKLMVASSDQLYREHCYVGFMAAAGWHYLQEYRHVCFIMKSAFYYKIACEWFSATLW